MPDPVPAISSPAVVQAIAALQAALDADDKADQAALSAAQAARDAALAADAVDRTEIGRLDALLLAHNVDPATGQPITPDPPPPSVGRPLLLVDAGGNGKVFA